MPPIAHHTMAGAVDEAGAVPPFSARDFRDAMGQFATGVVVVATLVDGDAHAMTANAFMSASLEPPLVLVSVACTARMHEKIRQARAFGVSVLSGEQQGISNHFAGKPLAGGVPAFERLHGLPVIRGAAVQVSATLEHAYPCGDHTLYVGRVSGLRRHEEPGAPLLFHGGRYGCLQPAVAG